MWCDKCQAEVAAEVSPDNRIRCATCSSDISPARTLRTTSRTQEARELLERWSNQRAVDPFGPVVAPERHIGQPAFTRPPLEDESPRSVPAPSVFRLDTPHFEPALTSPQPAAEAPQRERVPLPHARPEPAPEFSRHPMATQPHSVSPPTRVHSYHDLPAQSPHFDVESFVHRRQDKSNWVAVAGQLLAYGGVALLTVGTVLVLWGYFGGPEGYTPAGWLVSTAGQMLLFLGIVTLVSGGIEHTAHEVRSEIRRLGDKMVRIEQSTRDHSLRGPSIPAERFAEGQGDEYESSRQHALAGQGDWSRGNRR
jgi:hypothetical protein